MPEGWTDTRIAGVLQRRLEPRRDDRGSLTELWRERWTESMDGATGDRVAGAGRDLSPRDRSNPPLEAALATAQLVVR